MGAHRRTSAKQYLPPPPEPAQGRVPPTVIPQRERVGFLVRLAETLTHLPGLVTTAFAVIDGYAVLNAIPLDQPERAMTVGCAYNHDDGAWWFFNVRTGRPIQPANELNAAARQIRADLKQEVAV